MIRPVDPSTQVLINIIVEEVLTCDLCDQRMSLAKKGRLPKSLDCSHTFCMFCMEKYKSGMGIFSTIVCPTCSVETTVGISGVTGLKNNHTVISLINILEVFNAITCVECSVKPATLRCHSCPDKHSICESCHSDPRGPHAAHDVREIETPPPDSYHQRSGSGPSISRSSPLLFKSNQEDETTCVVECPRSIVGRVISSQGNCFDSVRTQTSCNIEFRRLSDRRAAALISIRGPKSSVQQAKKMIEQIMNDVQSSDVVSEEAISNSSASQNQQANYGKDDIGIEISHYDAIVLFELRHDDVLGIARNTSTAISLVHHAHHAHKIIIKPQSAHAQMDVARDMILRMLESVHESSSRGGGIGIPADLYEASTEVTDTIMLPTVQYHKLVSTGYAVLNKISLRVGCRIDVAEDMGTGMGVVTFRGNAQQVDEAQDLLRTAFDRRPHTFTSSSVPPGFQMNPSGDVSGEHSAHMFLSGHTSSQSPGQYQHHMSTLGDDRMKRPHSFTGLSGTSTAVNTQRGTPTTSSQTSSRPLSGVRVRSTKTTPMREGPVSAFIDCEYDSIEKLIGVKGTRIQELGALTDCQIFVLQGKGGNEGACVVEVRGKHDKVSTAVPLLKMVLGSGDVAMSKIRAMHSSLVQRSRSASSDDMDDVNSQQSQGRNSDGGDQFPLHQLAEALQQHIQTTVGTPDASDRYPVEELNRSSDISPTRLDGTPLSEGRPPRSRVISRQCSSKDEGIIDPAEGVPLPPSEGNTSSALEFSANITTDNREQTAVPVDSYVSSESDDDDDDNTKSVCRSMGSSGKYTVSPPSSPPPSSVYPHFFFQPNSLGRKEEKFECHEENASLLSSYVLDEIAMKARCQIKVEQERSQHQPMLLQLQGHADQRELAKLLINSVLKPAFYRSPSVNSSSSGLDGMIRTMSCPPYFIKVLIGPGGSTIEGLQTQTATKILINENLNEDRPPSISIIGTAAGVDAAVQLLDRMVTNQRFKYRQQPLTQDMRARSLPVLPSAVYAAKVEMDSRAEDSDQDDDIFEDGGAGGRTIMARTPSPPRDRKSGAFVPSRTPSGSGDKSTPSGSSQRNPCASPILEAMRKQNSVVSSLDSFSDLSVSNADSNSTSPMQFLKRPGQLSPSSTLSSIEYLLPPPMEDIPQGAIHIAMPCPADKVAQVIGKRGSILRELKRITECEIVVDQTPNSLVGGKESGGKTPTRTPPTTCNDDESSMPAPPQMIRIIGTPDCVDKAVKLISAVIEVGPIVALGMETVIMECPLHKVPLVIGTRGLTAKEMMRRTGCKIHVNEEAPEGSTMCTIELTGTDEQLDQAKTLISHVLEFGTKALGKRFQRGRKEDGSSACGDVR